MIIAIDGYDDYEVLEMTLEAMDRFEPGRVSLNSFNWENRKQFMNALGSRDFHFLAGNTWLLDDKLTWDQKMWWYERPMVGRGLSYMVFPYHLHLEETCERMGITVDPTVDQIVREALTFKLNKNFPKYWGNPEAEPNHVLTYPTRSYRDHADDSIWFMTRLATPRLMRQWGFTYANNR